MRTAPISLKEIAPKSFKDFGPALARALVILCLAGPVAAEGCFVDNLPAPNDADQYNARMRAVMLAHLPIEYRNSCGLLDESDQRYFDAIRTQAGCADSAGYQQFFGRVMGDEVQYAFAVRRTDLRSDEDFATYCQIVDRIDLDIALTDEGGIDLEMLQAQAPLFQAINAHVEKTRWQQ